jgi:hypothetical protein
VKAVARGIAALFVIAAAGLGLPGSAAAQQVTAERAEDGGDRIRLVAQTPWVGPGGQMDLTLAIEGAAESDLEIAAAVHQPVGSRSAFQRSLDGRGLGSLVTGGFIAARVAELERGPGGVVFMRLPVQDPTQPRDRNRLQLSRPGVYPVEVALRTTGETKALDQLVTHLVFTNGPAENPLNVGLVLPVHAPPAIAADGTSTRRAPARGIGELARALDARKDVSVTLSPTPETILTLERGTEEDAATLALLADASQRNQVLAEPFVPVSAAALDPVDGELTRQLSRGDEVMRILLGVRPDPRTRALASGITAAGVEVLADRSVDRVVVPEQLLVAAPRRLTLTEPFRLSTGGTDGPDAFAADAGLASHFDSDIEPALAAHHLLADLAVLFLDSPGSPDRAVVAQPPRSWTASSSFLEPLLAGLASSPMLTPLTLDSLFERVPVKGSGSSVETRRLADAVASIFGPEHPDTVRLNDALLASESSELGDRARTQRLSRLKERVGELATRITMASARTVTLTARRGGIPITIFSDVEESARVRIELSSSRLAFPEGDSRVLELDRENTTARFTVEARTSGSFPLRVRITSPDGTLLIADARVSVRSTAASGVGIFLSVGAAAFLAVWWASHALGRRRAP